MKRYDIFISYRRTSYETANLIATRLRAAGYSVFFDLETMRSGKFNEQLYDVIDSCQDFILVLSPDSLDRCANANDWVRLEACRAMDKGKNIIPVMLNGFAWPAPMPKGMEELRNYQALTASSIEYFDLAIQKLQQRYLKSKPHFPLRKAMKIAGTAAAALAAFILIMWQVFLAISKDTCQRYATIITKDAAQVHTLAETNHALKQDWEQFDNALNYERNPKRVRLLQEDMIGKIDFAIKEIENDWSVSPSALAIGPYQGFLLSLHGINSEELSASPQLATMYHNDFIDMLNIVRASVEDPTSISRRYSTALFKFSEYSFNAYYAAALSELTHFPDNTRTTFEELSKHWTYFPAQYKLGEDESYYENIINTEQKRADNVLSKYEGYLEQKDAELEDLERRSDALEEKINSLSNN